MVSPPHYHCTFNDPSSSDVQTAKAWGVPSTYEDNLWHFHILTQGDLYRNIKDIEELKEVFSLWWAAKLVLKVLGFSGFPGSSDGNDWHVNVSSLLHIVTQAWVCHTRRTVNELREATSVCSSGRGWEGARRSRCASGSLTAAAPAVDAAERAH